MERTMTTIHFSPARQSGKTAWAIDRCNEIGRSGGRIAVSIGNTCRLVPEGHTLISYNQTCMVTRAPDGALVTYRPKRPL